MTNIAYTGPHVGARGSDVSKITLTQNTSFHPGTIIDGHISAEDNEVLYDRYLNNWHKREWPEPLNFRGGVFGITAEMLLEIVEAGKRGSLNQLFGKARMNRILEAAESNVSTR